MHVAGETQKTLSGVMFDIHPDFQESYAKVWSHLYNLSLKPFYESPALSQVAGIVKERIHEGVRVHKKQLVGFQKVKQHHLLWNKLTSFNFLPLFPCKHILPIVHTYWNSMKNMGHQMTQAL